MAILRVTLNEGQSCSLVAEQFGKAIVDGDCKMCMYGSRLSLQTMFKYSGIEAISKRSPGRESFRMVA